jgi:hypothetical protein
MPCPQQLLLVHFDKPLNPADLGRCESNGIVQPNWIEPELSGTVVPFNMNVRRFDVIR